MLPYDPNVQPSLNTKYPNVHISAISFNLLLKMEKYSFLNKYTSEVRAKNKAISLTR